MNNRTPLLRQLHLAKRETEAQLEGIETAISILSQRNRGGRRHLSAAARARIAAAQKVRWAAYHKRIAAIRKRAA